MGAFGGLPSMGPSGAASNIIVSSYALLPDWPCLKVVSAIEAYSVAVAVPVGTEDEYAGWGIVDVLTVYIGVDDIGRKPPVCHPADALVGTGVAANVVAVGLLEVINPAVDMKDATVLPCSKSAAFGFTTAESNSSSDRVVQLAMLGSLQT